jgi:hypothetical protein
VCGFSHPGIIERARSPIATQRYAFTEGGGTPPRDGVRLSVLGIFPVAKTTFPMELLSWLLESAHITFAQRVCHAFLSNSVSDTTA